MDQEELFEEIRELLRDVQEGGVENPFEYPDEALVFPVRSAIRHIRVRGIPTDAAMAKDGTLDPKPTEEVGVLLALRVASRLISTDLLQRLQDGELGTYFRSGPDIMDTRGGTLFFEEAAERLDHEYQEMLTMLLADFADAASAMFSEPDLDAV